MADETKPAEEKPVDRRAAFIKEWHEAKGRDGLTAVVKKYPEFRGKIYSEANHD